MSVCNCSIEDYDSETGQHATYCLDYREPNVDIRGNSKDFSDALYAKCETDPKWAYDNIMRLRQKLASAMLGADTLRGNLEGVLNELIEEVAS